MEKAGKSLKEKFEERIKSGNHRLCFYAAVKKAFGERAGVNWDGDIQTEGEPMKRSPDTKKRTEDEIAFTEFQMRLYLKTVKALKEYARSKDIQIIGEFYLWHLTVL